MSLLLEALKRAEKAKEDAQRRAREGGGEAGSELRLEGEAQAGEAKRVVTRDELPPITGPLEIQSEDLRAEPTAASGLSLQEAAAPPPPPRRAPPEEPPAAQRAAARKVFEAARATLLEWTERLRDQAGDAFPERVTAFREGMAVHGRFRQPCPDCGAPVQRIVYAENETNYCARCQTGGRLLADRALSRLLKRDWPRSLDELEARRSA